VLATLQGHMSGVRCVAMTADGRLLASGSWDATVRLWDPRSASSAGHGTPSGRALASLEGHTGGVWGAALTADGRLLASGGLDGIIRLSDTPSGRLLATLQGQTGGVRGVTLSADGRLLASGSWDGTIRLWEARSGRPLGTLRGHTS